MRFIATIAIAVLLLAGGCKKNPVQPMPIPPKPPPVVPAPPPLPVPATWPELPLPPSRLPPPPQPLLPQDFRDGEASFLSGRYADAVSFFERFVREDPTTRYKDVAMFRIAMSQALLCASTECRARSLDGFRRLISLYPDSPYSAEARFLLSLQADLERSKADTRARDEKIKSLTEELEKLKKIDLERNPPRIKK